MQPDGFLAGNQGSPVLVLHPWWGLNETIKNFCIRLSQAGFMAFAPDLYHGKVTDTIAGAEALSSNLFRNFEQAKAEVAAAANFLKEQAETSEIAVIGFSMGAAYALDLSVSEPASVRSVVIFYGTYPADYSTARADYLGHFAAADEYEPAAEVSNLEQALKQAGRSVTFHHYEGTGHWFFEADRADAYHEAAANLAWERTLSFLKR